jgi:hypothetical protein
MRTRHRDARSGCSRRCGRRRGQKRSLTHRLNKRRDECAHAGAHAHAHALDSHSCIGTDQQKRTRTYNRTRPPGPAGPVDQTGTCLRDPMQMAGGTSRPRWKAPTQQRDTPATRNRSTSTAQPAPTGRKRLRRRQPWPPRRREAHTAGGRWSQGHQGQGGRDGVGGRVLRQPA